MDQLSVIAFATAEANTIHAICDRQLVPREIDGTVLTMSQRVNVLQQVCEALVHNLGMDPATVTH